MFFSLRSKQDVLRCVGYIGSLAFMGKVWQVRVEEYKPKRSLAQNRLFHAWIGEWAKERGDNPHDLKILVKHHVDLYEYVTNKITGEVVASLRSTSSLTVEEFTGLIQQLEIIAAKQGKIFKREEDYYESMGLNTDSAMVPRQRTVNSIEHVENNRSSAENMEQRT